MAASMVDPFRKKLLLGEQLKLLYEFDLDDHLVPKDSSRKIIMPQPNHGKITVFLDPTLRKTTAITKSQLIAALPRVLDMDVSLLSIGSNVNNQMQAITQGHVWITDAIGGELDFRSGAFLTQLAGGFATEKNGYPATYRTKDVVLGSCNRDIQLKLLEVVKVCFAGYIDFKSGY